jgi:hypothetical protein
MAQRTNLVMNDAQATPVSHTFGPTSGDGNLPGWSVIEYEDRAGGILAGYNRIKISTRKATTKLPHQKVVLEVLVPILETVSNSTVSGIAPAPTVAYTCISRMEFVLPARSALQARKDLRTFAATLLQNSEVIKAIETLESPW